MTPPTQATPAEWSVSTPIKVGSVPDRSWLYCEGCGMGLVQEEPGHNLRVCPDCDHHHAVPARERVVQLLDGSSFQPWCEGIESGDPLGFDDNRPYHERLRAERGRTGMDEAVLVGRGRSGGLDVVLGITDSRFLMGSMGSVVGEMLTRAVEAATLHRLPLILVSGSGGGARLHEGAFSLMQMAKVAAALARHHDAGLLCLSVLTNPTFGGAASFAMASDLILAEPGARIGYTSPVILAQHVRGATPVGFQTSEFLLEHGFIDRVVHRRNLREELVVLLEYLHTPAKFGPRGLAS